MLIYAIIPARSGSKGLPNKNIQLLCGKELIGYSIAFAKELPVQRIFCSTDSSEYAEIAKKYGAEVPFLRSDFASDDKAMEEDILQDLYAMFAKYAITQPDLLIWLRPTFVFRDKNSVIEAIEKLVKDETLTSCRVVVRAESRLYSGCNGLLIPQFNDHGKSMIRRQDLNPMYRVYSTDIIRSNTFDYSKAFLGNRVGYVEAPKICGLDIDDELDFQIIESLMKRVAT
jgi:hypothetical protein